VLCTLPWLVLSACADHEVGIKLTAAGVTYLETACKPTCDRMESPDGGPLPGCACVLPERAAPDLVGHPSEARIFLWTPHDSRIRDTGKCMSLLACNKGTQARQTACLAESLNQQLDGAIPGGLGFDGLKSASGAELLLAFYAPTSSSGDAETHCALDDLVACAGLAPPLSGGSYDVACASCRAGAKVAAGRDTGPCPRTAGDRAACFLQTCAALLATRTDLE
jgi:hypothetical protein